MFDKIRMLGDPVLIQKVNPILITEFDDDLGSLAKQMFEIMYEAEGVGLAANQIGILKSIFVYDNRQHNSGVICNPTIMPIGMQRIEDYEGCLSIPDQYHPVLRYARVEVVGQDLEGATIRVEGNNFLARIFQHEIDHLYGKLYISKLSKATQAGILLGKQVMH